MELDYQRDSIESIVKHATALTGRSLIDFFPEIQDVDNIKQKGQLGNLVEEYFFQIPISSHSGPDFLEAGLELKVTGVTKKESGKFAAKERLVLTMIDFHGIVKEDWSNCHLRKKCGIMLILFYLYEAGAESFRRKFVLDPLVFRLDGADSAIIQRDWETIQAKVASGLAHELSEGDTLYLGACRKGSGGANESLRSQPFSVIPAPARAFALKQSYLSKIVQGHSDDDVSITENGRKTLEEVTAEKFKPYFGLTVTQIAEKLGFAITSPRPKSLNFLLVKRVLGNGTGAIVEFEKAGIQIKTVRLKANGMPKESMSFSSFSFDDLAQQAWEDSTFYRQTETKFLFAVFRVDNEGTERLEAVQYWNMPYDDRCQARIVWEATASKVRASNTQFPKASENLVAHVRPHGRNAADTDVLPDGSSFTKQSFWLNRQYIASVIRNLSN
jgi:DNA mismatch repair protein MutH